MLCGHCAARGCAGHERRPPHLRPQPTLERLCQAIRGHNGPGQIAEGSVLSRKLCRRWKLCGSWATSGEMMRPRLQPLRSGAAHGDPIAAVIGLPCWRPQLNLPWSGADPQCHPAFVKRTGKGRGPKDLPLSSRHGGARCAGATVVCFITLCLLCCQLEEVRSFAEAIRPCSCLRSLCNSCSGGLCRLKGRLQPPKQCPVSAPCQSTTPTRATARWPPKQCRVSAPRQCQRARMLATACWLL